MNIYLKNSCFHLVPLGKLKAHSRCNFAILENRSTEKVFSSPWAIDITSGLASSRVAASEWLYLYRISTPCDLVLSVSGNCSVSLHQSSIMLASYCWWKIKRGEGKREAEVCRLLWCDLALRPPPLCSLESQYYTNDCQARTWESN